MKILYTLNALGEGITRIIPPPSFSPLSVGNLFLNEGSEHHDFRKFYKWAPVRT